MNRGGKLEGLESLVEHTNLGFRLVDFHSIDPALFEQIEKQRVGSQLLNVLTDQQYSPDTLPLDIQRLVDELAEQYQGKTIIVRSNSLNEGGAHSFRGRYDSVIVEHTDAQKLAATVRKVYDSFYAERAARYRQEHGIKDDKLGVLIGEFIEPEYSGVMHTSNPSYPSDLTIEFCLGRNRVVDGTVQPFIIDYDKETKKEAFRSESLKAIATPRGIKRLFEIGTNLESRIGPSSLEFVVKDGEIYLVQREPINDLAEPVEVEIPKYRKSQLVGSTQIKRGRGKITLPVVVMEEWGEIEDKALLCFATGRNDEAGSLYERFIKGAIKKNGSLPQGYILIIPHFYEMELAPGLVNTGQPTSLDAMTSNKKAIITTNCASISSHVMTIARERGIAYAGFTNPNLFEGLSTGDVVSIYFKGREAIVYRERDVFRSIKETHPSMRYNIKAEDSGIHVETIGDANSHTAFTSDFGFFLENATSTRWEFKPFSGRMGGTFFDSKRRAIIMSMYSLRGQYGFHVDSGEICSAFRRKPLPQKEFNRLMTLYVEYLTK